jgi:hypothetical protein
MIRTTRSVMERCVVCAIACICVIAFLANTKAIASDHDGINGYSMKLKAKIFDTGDGSNGGSNTVTQPVQEKDKVSVVPQTTLSIEYRSIVLGAFWAWYSIWLR